MLTAMIEITEEDFLPLESFRLKWRWTDPQHNVLPPKVLANIRPLVPAKAREFDERDAVLHPDGGFLPGTYLLIDEVNTEHEDTERVREWLRSHIPNPEETVVVCWNFIDAVVTTPAIFSQYWDDFCYPASDDESISPLSGEWIFFYWHEEAFFFGKRPGD